MKVLVVAAHPDDEVLGCGASMAAHARCGDEVRVMIMAEGITSRAQQYVARAKGALARLRTAARKANRMLGVSRVDFVGLPDNRMDSIPLLEVVRKVEKVVHSYKPDLVYTHHAGDLNVDHRLTQQAVNTACRPIPGHRTRTLLYFEIQSSTDWQPPSSAPFFAPDWYMDVSATLDAKLSALAFYVSEMRPWPHSRSIQSAEALARLRGASVGVDAAEAFMLGRHLQTPSENALLRP